MHIKQVIVEGFKTYREQTTVDFQPHLNCIGTFWFFLRTGYDPDTPQTCRQRHAGTRFVGTPFQTPALRSDELTRPLHIHTSYLTPKRFKFPPNSQSARTALGSLTCSTPSGSC
jgi:hypothetical protein